MMRKLLFTGITGILALAISSALYLNDNAQYQPRVEKQDAQTEPYSMKWAKLDLRTGEYNPYASQEIRHLIQNKASRSDLDIDFISRGPDNVGGRTRALIELFEKPDTLLAGSVTGGLWVSYNAGATWQPHDQFNNLEESSSIIGDIHQDTISGKIYIGTGSSFEGGATTTGIGWPGYGMFVSSDEGETFTHIESTTPDNRYSTNSALGGPWIAINRIVTDKDNNIYAATHAGLFKSSDGGETWINPVYQSENMINPYTDICGDIEITKQSVEPQDGGDESQRILVAYAGGRVYLSENGGDDKTYVQINNRGLLSASRRTVIAISDSDPDVMYVMFAIAPDACLGGVYKSTDGGQSFLRILVRHDDFSPIQGGAEYCQGAYDLAIDCDPRDPNTIYIGGVEVWRYDGSLTRIASEAGSPPTQDIMPFYVHADKHLFYHSPNDQRRMYVTTDGGISMTTNRGETWQGINKGYITTQFYGITFFNGGGAVMGGTQDNGTLIVLGENENDPKVGYSVYGNDGIDCDASQNMPIVFATSQNGLVVRADVSAGTSTQPSYAMISEMDRNNPVFRTVVKLWESTNDKTSQDSILFEASTSEFAVATGNGILRNFNETVTPLQPAANVIETSVEIRSGDQVITVNPNDPNELVGDGEGSITFNANGSMDISITFDNAPAENANVFVTFEVTYEANDIVFLESNNLKTLQESFTFEHRLESDMNPGDQIKVQDPAQSILFSTGASGAGGVNSSVRLYRNVLNTQQVAPDPIPINAGGANITCIEISDDGDVAFIGNSSGSVFRVSGLNQVYSEEDADDFLSVTNILGSFQGPVTGIALDHTDNNRLVVTGGGYNRSDRVQMSENALSTNPTFKNVHGDLAPMPIYDAEFNVNDPNMVLVGTEFGIWGTGDVTATTVTWSDENSALTYTPVYDIRQQWLPFEEASNSGMMFVGTHGRGLWQSGSEVLVGVPEFGDIASSEKAVADFKVYPNPVQGAGSIGLETNFNGNVTLSIYDLNGRQIRTWSERVANGNNTFAFDTHGLRTGSYFAIVDADNGERKTTKFMVMR